MTPEERARFSDLCAQIQNEKNVGRFEQLVREATALMSAKMRRFPQEQAPPARVGEKLLTATATRTLRAPSPDADELVELHLTGGQPLYSEIRIANSFTDAHGKALALKPPALVDVKFQAPADCFVPKQGKTAT